MEIINIRNRVVNNLLIRTEQGYIVVDTGYPGNYKQFNSKLKRNHISPGDIKFIFITHVHDDHIGFLNELIADTDANIIMHKESPRRLLSGHNEYKGGASGLAAKLFIEAMKIAGKGKHTFPPVNICDKVMLWDGTQQFFRKSGLDIDIISLPGHTSDSIGLLTDGGELICGDACMNGFPSVKRNIIWIENLEDYKKSWDTMIKSSANTIFPSHGNPFPKKDLIRYRPYLDKIKLHPIKFQ